MKSPPPHLTSRLDSESDQDQGKVVTKGIHEAALAILIILKVRFEVSDRLSGGIRVFIDKLI